MPSLTLHVPGMADPTQCAALPRDPLYLPLQRWLARATVEQVAMSPCLDGLLAAPPTADYPVAACTALGDGLPGGDGYWLRADPVHLRAEQRSLRLLGNRGLSVSSDEAAALVATLNTRLAQDDMHFIAPYPQRWYLRLATPPDLVTTPLIAAIGRDVDGLLPTGGQGRVWRALLNEVQMLFHAHPVNEARQMAGSTPINSVWFWGGGQLPALRAGDFGEVYGDSPLITGLALAAGLPVCADMDSDKVMAAAAAGSVLVSLTDLAEAADYADEMAWQAALARLLSGWINPALTALRCGRITVLRLLPGDGCCYRLTRASWRRFWRRSVPLSMAFARTQA